MPSSHQLSESVIPINFLIDIPTVPVTTPPKIVLKRGAVDPYTKLAVIGTMYYRCPQCEKAYHHEKYNTHRCVKIKHIAALETATRLSCLYCNKQCARRALNAHLWEAHKFEYQRDQVEEVNI